MHLCYFCNKGKPEEEFNPSCLKINYHICKECINGKRKDWKRNFGYLTNSIWSHQIHSKNKARVEYTFEQFARWLGSNERFMDLYRLWLECDCDRSNTPSIIRVDPDKSFSFENLMVVTAKQAREKNIHKRARIVIQLDLNGVEISKYQNARVAANFISMKSYISIHKVCRGERKTAGGFKWKYAEEKIK